MEKLNVQIIHNKASKMIHVSTDFGAFEIMHTNRIIRTLIRIILNPERYNVQITEY